MYSKLHARFDKALTDAGVTPSAKLPTITRPEHESRPVEPMRPMSVHVRVLETPDGTTEVTTVDSEVRQVETTDANATAWRLFGKLALGGAK